jgi:glycosyltransferase involved in cell wall biosynthesis
MGLSGHCRFIGLLTPDEVRTWMQWCDVFVLPSLSESFGIVLGEAMACGKPVISTHCGGPDYVVTPETGLLVDVANAEGLAEAMQSFIEGKVEFDSRTIRESVVKRFGEQAFIEATLNVYRQVLNSK